MDICPISHSVLRSTRKVGIMQRFTILVPKYDNDGTEYQLDYLERTMARMFGGYSILDGLTVNGGWISDNGTFFRDSNYIVFIVQESHDIARCRVALFAYVLNQLSIYLEYNGSVEFVDASSG